MNGETRTILVDLQPTAPWVEMLRQSASGLGMDLDITGAAGIELLRWADYDLVVLGSSVASRSADIIALVRDRARSSRIVVFSTRPDWREAREALLAGAVDYAPVPGDSRSLLTTLAAALEKAPYVNAYRD